MPPTPKHRPETTHTLSSRIRRWFARRTSPIRHAPLPVRPYLEPLEDRTLMAVSILGSVFQDLNADGVRAAEPGLAGVTVFIDDGSHAFNGTQRHALTSGSGDFVFSDLAAGAYSLGLALPAGQSLTFPTSGSFRGVTVPAAGAATGADFGVLANAATPENEQVTADASVQQMPSVAVNPTDPTHVVMAYMDYGLKTNGYAGIGISVSHDSGATWTRSSVPLPSDYSQAAGNPAVRFDAAGDVYVSFMAATFLGKDSDGSALKPGVIYDTTTQTVTYLNKSVSRRAFGLQANNGVFVAKSTDGGATWDTPVAVSAQRYDLTFTSSASGLTAGSGRVVTPAQMPTGLFVGKVFIIDEGLASQERVTVTAFTSTTFTANFAKDHAAGFTVATPVFFDAQPDMVIDTSATSTHSGNMYMTWTRFYPAGLFPGRTASLSGSEIMLAVSSDQGQTWTTLKQAYTSSAAAVTAGSGRVVTPALMPPGTSVGRVLIIDEGLASQESVTVTASTATTFTANFAKDHAAGFTISPVSSDGGPDRLSVVKDPLTAVAGATGVEGTGSNTLPRVTVDAAGGVYVSQFAGNRFPVFYSSDAGASFRAPNPTGSGTGPGTAPFDYTGYPFGIDDDRYGAIYVAGASSPSFIPRASLFNNTFRTQAVRSIVADPTRPGHVYAVEAVQILTAGGTVIDAGEITFSRSADFGLTWSTQFTVGSNTGNKGELAANQQFRYRSVLNDDDGGRFLGFDPTLGDEVISGQALPQMSIDAQGNIAVIWYDTRRDPNNTRLDVYGTVSTDGGLTFSANSRISASNFLAGNGAFTDGRGAANNPLLGDRIGLALSDGKAYAAWTATDTQAGNQDIVFSRYSLTPASVAFDDRFEANDSAATFTDLGTVTTRRLVPRLGLSSGNADWYRVTAGATGDLVVAATGASAGATLQLDLYAEDGTTLLASGSASGGAVAGRELTFRGTGGQKYLIRLSGSGSYSLAIQSLTADLGSPAEGSASGSIAGGASAIYRLAAPIGGSLDITLTSGGDVTGNLNLTVLSADGQTVLASGVPAGASGPGEVERAILSVEGGQVVLIQVNGAAGSAAGSFQLGFRALDLFETANSSSLLFPVGGSSSSVTTGDVNADLRPDLILTSTQGGDLVRVMLGNADGTFQPPRTFDVGAGQFAFSAREPVLGDFDDDNALDLVVPNYYSADVSVLAGNGDGTFAPQARYDSVYQANSAASGDFNGDRNLDLAVLDRVAGSVKLVILEGRGDGSFRPPIQVPDAALARLVRGDAFPVRVGELNGDGKLDVIVFGPNDNLFQVLLGNGDGTFTAGATVSSGEAFLDAQLADVNGDTKLDVVVGGSNSGTVLLFLGNGDGTFAAAQGYATAPVLAGDNVLIVGLAVGDFGGTAGRGSPDGKLDVVVTTRSRNGADVPQLYMLAGITPGADGKVLAAARKLATLKEAGRIAAGDFDRDGALDLALTQTEGVRVLYGVAPAFLANTTPANATDLGTVTHSLSPTRAIVTGFTDAYYKLTVPTESAAGAGDQVVDFSGGFAAVQGAGLGMEILDAQNNVIGSGERLRLRVAQGATLTVHIFARPAGGGQPRGAGLYNLAVTVLPQVVGVEGHWVVPGVNGGPGGPTTSLVVTFQGARLDPAAAQDAANYVVTWLGADGVAGTADDRLITPRTAGGSPPVLYSPGTNVDVATGRTVPSAVRQTVTLAFAEGLPAGSYRIEFKPGLRAAPFNSAEASLLSAKNGFTGLPLVSLSDPGFAGGATLTLPDLVKPAGPAGGFEAFKAGTPWLTQLHADLSALLDGELGKSGDAPAITAQLLKLVTDKFMPGVAGRPESFLILVFDPVSIDVVDPKGDRAVVDLKTNTVTNTQPRTFVQAGGNVEVMVLAGVSGSYVVNLSDVQATARAGAVMVQGGEANALVLTPSLRDGERSFTFDFNEKGPGTTTRTTPVQTSLDALASVTGLAFQVLASLDGADGQGQGGLGESRIGQLVGGIVLGAILGIEGGRPDPYGHLSPEERAAAQQLSGKVTAVSRTLAAELMEAWEMGGRGDLVGFGNKAADAIGRAIRELAAEAAALMARFPEMGNDAPPADGAAPMMEEGGAAAPDAEVVVAAAEAAEEAPLPDGAGLLRALGLATVFASGAYLTPRLTAASRSGRRGPGPSPKGATAPQ